MAGAMAPGSCGYTCIGGSDEDTPCFVDVIFEVRDAQTRWGEVIRVAGAHFALGGWSLEQAVQLTTCEDVYPTWRSHEVRLCRDPDQDCPSNQIALAYKYVRDAGRLGEGVVWETTSSDRQVLLPTSCVPGSVWIISDSGFGTDAPCDLRQETSASYSFVSQAPEETPEVPTARGFDSKFTVEGQKGNGPLGRGGFSVVWRCRERGGSGREFAVKRICKAEMPHRGRRFLFGQGAAVGEINLHKNLEHKNIVKLFEVFDDRDYVSLVMELCRGGDLFDVVTGHRRAFDRGLPERAAASVARQLLTALAFLHKQGIVHRDVKCENIFQLEARGSCKLEEATFKLGDFGLATRVQPDEVLIEQVGSPSYSAPEVVHFRPYSMPADMWSAGATLYTALAARRPFEATTYAQMLRSSGKGYIPLVGDYWDTASAPVLDLLRGLLEPQARLRPTAEAALEHPWLRP